VTFDPDVISYREILEIFFTVHDPTTLNRQGNDVGTQYRSAIFHASEEQAHTARTVIGEMSAQDLWDDPVVTEVAPLDVFFPAEDYHDAYFQRNGNQPYCQFVVAPKVVKFRQKYAHRLKG
jgi:peptide-methionine (S)-S-oxide reductase